MCSHGPKCDVIQSANLFTARSCFPASYCYTYIFLIFICLFFCGVLCAEDWRLTAINGLIKWKWKQIHVEQKICAKRNENKITKLMHWVCARRCCWKETANGVAIHKNAENCDFFLSSFGCLPYLRKHRSHCSYMCMCDVRTSEWMWAVSCYSCSRIIAHGVTTEHRADNELCVLSAHAIAFCRRI